MDLDCVSAWIDNSTASANRRPKIRLVVRSVLNSEVCMGFGGFFFLFVCSIGFVYCFVDFFCERCGFFLVSGTQNNMMGCGTQAILLFSFFFNVIFPLQALHTFKVDTNFELFSILCIPCYMEGWLLLLVSLELLSVCVIT